MGWSKSIGLAGAGKVFCVLAILSSCSTINLASNRAGWSDYAPIAVKDYLVLGSVRITCEEVVERGFLGIANSNSGSKVTYDLLLKEARKLGADDVINVRIDQRDVSSHGILDWLLGYTEKHAYSANALAIKYAEALQGYGQATALSDRTQGGRLGSSSPPGREGKLL